MYFIHVTYIATCCVYCHLYYANTTTAGKHGGLNCTGITSSENNVLQLKNNRQMLYRCKKFTANGSDSKKLIEVVSEL